MELAHCAPPGPFRTLQELKLPTPLDVAQRLTSAEARELQRELLELALEQDPKVRAAPYETPRFEGALL